jgi:type II secretory pathway component PulF
MIWVSNFMLNYTIPFVIVIVFVLGSLFFLYRTKKKMLLNVLFSLPIIKKLAEQIDLTRFSRSLYLLLNSGLPITSALELAEDVVAKKDMARAITHAKETVLAGRKLSDGFKDNKKVFPSMMIKITEAGEKTGSLDKSMQDISEYMDYEVSKSLASITTLLEPIMLIFVGIMVGGMMLSIIAPIYGLVGQVGQAGVH